MPLEAELRGIVKTENKNISVTLLANILSDNNTATVYTDEEINVITEVEIYNDVNVGDFIEAKWNNFSSIFALVDEFDIEEMQAL